MEPGRGYIMHNNSGILWNNSKALRNGNLGNALKFDGVGNYVDVPTGTDYDGKFTDLTSFSVSIWAEVRPILAGSEDVVFRKNSFNPHPFFLLSHDYGIGIMQFQNGQNFVGNNSSGYIVDNKMCHYVITWDNVSGIIYGYRNADLITKSNPLAIGSKMVNAGTIQMGVYASNFTQSIVASIKVFNKRLNKTEIDYLFTFENIVPSTAQANLIAGWDFNEKSGTVLKDSSGSGFDGTLTGYGAGTTTLGVTNSWLDSYTYQPIER